MTDHELLELAAKAADLLGFFVDAGMNLGSNEKPVIWNPLKDDGDALRLAERLNMTVCMDGTGTVSASRQQDNDAFVTQSIRECTDRLAATRRAIVRAAAEIGKQMTEPSK